MDLGFIACCSAPPDRLAADRCCAARALPLLLCLHLGVVMALFATMPYGKFAHGVYRSAALLKWANCSSGSPSAGFGSLAGAGRASARCAVGCRAADLAGLVLRTVVAMPVWRPQLHRLGMRASRCGWALSGRSEPRSQASRAFTNSCLKASKL
jgi:hypothetical protein